MVRYCKACHKPYQQLIRDGRSFHKFPTDQRLKEMWCEILGISCSQVNKFTEICSNHFRSDQFSVRASRRFLKQDAIPEIQVVTPNSEAPGSSKSLFDSSPPLVAVEFRTKIIGEDSGSSTITAEVEEMLPTVGKETSSTLFNVSSDVGSVSSVRSISEKESFCTSTKKRSKLTPRYIGDCSTSDMDSPTQARRSWKVAKSTISAQRKKIKNLQRTKRRLKSRIVCLNSLMSYLRQQFSLSKHADSAIKVSRI